MDCFLIEGEAFVFRVGLALLICCESEMLKLSHYQIKDRLRNFKDLDEEHFFLTVQDRVVLDDEAFLNELKKQQWGYDKERVLAFDFDS